MKIKVFYATQLIRTVEADGQFAGRIVNRDGRGRWIFTAASAAVGDADHAGPLAHADGRDVTHAINSVGLEAALQ